MENLASMAILLAFAVALYAVIASVAGQIKHKPFLVVSGSRAFYAVWSLITLAAAVPLRAPLRTNAR